MRTGWMLLGLLIYQGKMRPGTQPGEVIEQQSR